MHQHQPSSPLSLSTTNFHPALKVLPLHGPERYEERLGQYVLCSTTLTVIPPSEEHHNMAIVLNIQDHYLLFAPDVQLHNVHLTKAEPCHNEQRPSQHPDHASLLPRLS